MLSALLHWLARQPLRRLHALGVVAGWLTYLLSPTYRRRGDANAANAGLQRAQARPAVASAGRMVLELPFLWLRPADMPITPWVQWQGAEVMESALVRAASAGRGLLCLTPHQGAFEVIAQAYAERWGTRAPMTVLYRPARKPWLRDLVDGARARPGLATAPATLAGVRQMIRALRRGEVVGLLPDQVPPEGMGVWAPFFGRPAYTMTLAARLAEQTGAETLLMRCTRRARGAGYVVHVEQPAAALPAGDPSAEAHQVECASWVNREMERLIRQSPGEYLWGYHRYKAPRRARLESA